VLRARQEELRELFAGCGEVLGVRLARAAKSEARIAFVDLATRTALLKAKKLKGTILRGLPLAPLPCPAPSAGGAVAWGATVGWWGGAV
jgi:hypothetical protein